MIQNILNFLKKLIPIDLDSMVLESSENESNVYQKYGVAAAAGTAVALFSLFLMAFLIATGEVQLDEIKTRKIVDIVMPQRDPELLDSVERPEEAEPEPEPRAASRGGGRRWRRGWGGKQGGGRHEDERRRAPMATAPNMAGP